MSVHQSEPGDDPGQTLRLPDSGYPARPPLPKPPAAPLPATPPVTAQVFLPELPLGPPADGDPHGGGHRRDPVPPWRRRPFYWVAAVLVVSGLAVGGVMLAFSGSADKPATTSSAQSAPVADPGVPAAVAPSPSSTLSLAQARLADLLDPFELRYCQPSPVEGRLNADAALVCEADDVGKVRALHYFDADALTDEVAQRSSAIHDVGACSAGKDSVEVWGRSTERLGTLMCFSNADGSHLFWTIDDALVGFEVSGPDGVELVAWWRGFDPLA